MTYKAELQRPVLADALAQEIRFITKSVSEKWAVLMQKSTGALQD
jgi:hypothetical protein